MGAGEGLSVVASVVFCLSSGNSEDLGATEGFSEPSLVFCLLSGNSEDLGATEGLSEVASAVFSSIACVLVVEDELQIGSYQSLCLLL